MEGPSDPERIRSVIRELDGLLMGLVGTAYSLGAKLQDPQSRRDAHQIEESGQRVFELVDTLAALVGIPAAGDDDDPEPEPRS